MASSCRTTRRKLVDGAPYELVGKFVLGNRLDFFPDYKDGWRKGLCYPQLPLVVIPIFTWAVVPTYWPCIPSYGMTRAEAIDTAKTLAWSAGANLVLLTYRGADAGEQIGRPRLPHQDRPRHARTKEGEAAPRAIGDVRKRRTARRAGRRHVSERAGIFSTAGHRVDSWKRGRPTRGGSSSPGSGQVSATRDLITT